MLTIIEVFMRRFLAIIALPLLVCLAIVGCGSSKPAATASPTATANSNAAVTATGTFGTTPVVTIPKLKATNKLVVKTLIQGTGATVTKTDFIATNFVLYFWNGTSSALKLNTFTSNPAVTFVVCEDLTALLQAPGDPPPGAMVIVRP